MKLTAGTPVRITKGSNKGKKGIVGSNRPSNGIQKGKVPVVVGSRNEVLWTRPEWVASDESLPSTEATPTTAEDIPVATKDNLRQLADTEKRILGFLLTRKVPVTDAEIAIALDLPMYQASMSLRLLEQDGLVSKNDEDGYHLPAFKVGCYVKGFYSDRTGLITSEEKGIFTITFADETELQCTIEDLRENFTVCGNQLELLDSSRVSADSLVQPNSSADLNGSSQLTTTQMPVTSCVTTSTTELLNKTSEITTPHQEPPTSTPSDSPATTPAPLETEPDSTAMSQGCGLKHSDVLLKDYLNSSLSSSQRASFIEACEQSLADSEWQVISGTIRSFYRQLVSEQRNAAPDFLQLPTLTAGDGTTNSRPAGIVKCDKAARKLGLIFDSQYLSVQFMAAISGFPLNWTACLLECPRENGEESEGDTSTVEQSSHTKQLLPSSESSTSTPCVPGKQWLDPARIILKDGTQYRHYVDAAYAANVRVAQGFTEAMQEGLWDWHREPLPVAFLSVDGKIYIGDGHHRVSAAYAAKKQIYVDLRPGELVDAILFSCQSNTDHGLPLRAKDQRKRIELFLNTLDSLDAARSRQLLESIPNLSEIERRNGKWSARVIAKYLKLTESGYRTIINIVQERDMAGYFSQLSEGDWVRVKDNCADGSDFPWGTIAKIDGFDKRKGVFIIPLPGAVGGDGRILPSGYIHPGCLEKTEPPPLLDTGKNSLDKPTSIKQELEQQAEAVGLSSDEQVLPDVERNQGDPDTLVDDRPFATPGLVVDEIESFVNRVDQLPPEQIDKVWNAIAPYIPDFWIELLGSSLPEMSSVDLRNLIYWASNELNARGEEVKNAS